MEDEQIHRQVKDHDVQNQVNDDSDEVEHSGEIRPEKIGYYGERKQQGPTETIYQRSFHKIKDYYDERHHNQKKAKSRERY